MVAIAFKASNILEKQVKTAIISKMCEELAPLVVMHTGFVGTRMIDMLVGDPLPSMVEEYPLVWIVEVNGLPVDVHAMPREVQKEAYRLGLIPYVP